MYGTWRSGCADGHLRNGRRSQHLLNDGRNSPAKNAVRTRVFGMQRSEIERLPSRDSFSGIIPVDVTVANSGHRTPKHIVILRSVNRLDGIRFGKPHYRHEARSIDHRHLLGNRDLAHPGVIGDRPSRQPKACQFGLLRSPFVAKLLADFPYLIVVARPGRALEIGRRSWTELVGFVQDEGGRFCRPPPHP